jgi:N-hydroxyarylamine O-acetyltransferase
MSAVLTEIASPISPLDAGIIDRYLALLGFSERPPVTVEMLTRLQERHVLTVPFENLDYHYGREIYLDERVVAKVADERRGGGCYELNPSLHYLLRELGFQSRILPGRSYRNGELGAPYMHLVLEVTVEGRRYLVDSGFRRNSRRPLRLDDRGEQADPHGTYRVEQLPSAEIDLYLNGDLLYRADLRGATIEDFYPTLWWWRTSPESPFLQSLFCSLPLDDGRVTLAGSRLSIVRGQDRDVVELIGDAEIRKAYETYFGICLDRLPNASDHVGSGPGIRVE